MGQSTKLSVEIAPECYVTAALMVLLLPLPWLCAWLVAAAVHEGCHLLALLICRKRADRIDIGLHGAQIYAPVLKPGEQLFCTLAGPFGAMLLLAFKVIFPRLAICALVQSIFNLLPVLPLDGGHALECMLSIFFPERLVEKFFMWEGRVFGVILLIVSVIAVISLKSSIFLLVILAYLAMWYKKIKFPCKSKPNRVQ